MPKILLTFLILPVISQLSLAEDLSLSESQSGISGYAASFDDGEEEEMEMMGADPFDDIMRISGGTSIISKLCIGILMIPRDGFNLTTQCMVWTTALCNRIPITAAHRSYCINGAASVCGSVGTIHKFMDFCQNLAIPLQ